MTAFAASPSARRQDGPTARTTAGNNLAKPHHMLCTQPLEDAHVTVTDRKLRDHLDRTNLTWLFGPTLIEPVRTRPPHPLRLAQILSRIASFRGSALGSACPLPRLGARSRQDAAPSPLRGSEPVPVCLVPSVSCGLPSEALMADLKSRNARVAVLDLPGQARHQNRCRQHYQRSCQATPKTLNSLPVRVEIPVLAFNFRELWRSNGSASVKPARVFDCSLSPLTPFVVVRPPVK